MHLKRWPQALHNLLEAGQENFPAAVALADDKVCVFLLLEMVGWSCQGVGHGVFVCQMQGSGCLVVTCSTSPLMSTLANLAGVAQTCHLRAFVQSAKQADSNG